MHKKIVVAISFLLAGNAHAASVVLDSFDANLGSWIANTTQTNVSHQVAGGNPGGFLQTDNTGNNTFFYAVGAVNTSTNYSGVFAPGLWNIAVDLNFMQGNFGDALLRFRFHDSSANGWHTSLTNAFTNTWNTRSVIFDTTWSDADAISNGWVKESDGILATPSFAGLWGDVYTSEVRLLGTTSSTNLVAGIDNYSAMVVPIPAAIWLLGSGLVGLIAVTRRGKARC